MTSTVAGLAVTAWPLIRGRRERVLTRQDTQRRTKAVDACMAGVDAVATLT